MNYLSEYNSGDAYMAENFDAVVDGLKVAASAKGLKQSDIAEMTGFGAPKINKVFKGNQTATADDCRDIARALGCVIRHDPKAKDPLEGYKFVYQTEGFAVLLHKIQEAESFSEACIIAGYEMVVAILNHLGLDAKDYIIEAVNRPRGNKKLFGEGSHDDGLRLMFTHRHVFKDSAPIKFGVMISPKNREVVFGIWFDPDEVSESDSGYYVEECRKAIDSDSEIEPYIRFAKANERWIPRRFRDSVVDAAVMQDEDLDDDRDLELSLETTFREYCRLIKLQKNIDIADYSMKDVPSTLDMMFSITDPCSFTPEVRANLINEHDSVCDVDSEHELFEGADGNPYVELIPIIPLVPEAFSKYGKALQSSANSAVLCPMCAAKLRHGSADVKEEIICSIYNKYKKQLKDAHMDVQLLHLLSWYSTLM